ncbi:MAG: hypothetical protein JJ975_10595 [Bacteroidia bacterium]|nr:hypothetical protein [Bacteroidia bacterium]
MVSRILYYGLIKPLSWLPFWMLYRFSDFLFILLYYAVGYRKKVVLSNLRNAFPGYSDEEINRICRAHYKHLADLIIESIKLFSIHRKEVAKRFVFLNPEVILPYYEQGKSIILAGGHYNSWEMLALAVDDVLPHQCIALYSRLSNPFFDRIMLTSRSRYGLTMISTKAASRFFSENTQQRSLTIFGADQSPTYSKNVVWTLFLNQETAVARGTEKYAKQYDYPVFFGRINKVKRGYYTFELELVTDTPQTTKDGEITIRHTAMLESQITNDPPYWLWTHKRWKRKRKEGEEMVRL